MKSLEYRIEKDLDENELRDAIVNGEKEISGANISARDQLRSCLASASKLGTLISYGRERMGNQFKDWLKTNCPSITPEKTIKYVKVARSTLRIENLSEDDQMNLALGFVESEKKESDDEEKIEKVDQNLNRILSLKKFLEKHPLHSWSGECIQEFKSLISVYAKDIWPEKFQ